MNREDYFAKLRYFMVNCFEPPPEDTKAWGKHWAVGVVCRSAAEALDTVREKHPTYRIEAVNERGIVHHLAESSVNG